MKPKSKKSVTQSRDTDSSNESDVTPIPPCNAWVGNTRCQKQGINLEKHISNKECAQNLLNQHNTVFIQDPKHTKKLNVCDDHWYLLNPESDRRGKRNAQSKPDFSQMSVASRVRYRAEYGHEMDVRRERPPTAKEIEEHFKTIPVEDTEKILADFTKKVRTLKKAGKKMRARGKSQEKGGGTRKEN